MATVGTIQMMSRALGYAVTYSILLPEPEIVGPGPYPVLAQLHGRSDSHTAWLYKSKIEVYVKQLPLIVVFPDGGISFWADYNAAARYETFVVQDLWDHVTTMFPTRRESRWAIGGLSMGGLGALRLGLKYPDKYCSICAHSSYIPTEDELLHWEVPPTPDVRKELDCYQLAERIEAEKLPRLGFDCGVDDVLIEHNRRFHRLLDQRKLPHHYAEHPGGHTWEYWDEHVPAALRQHAEVLKIAAVPR